MPSISISLSLRGQTLNNSTLNFLPVGYSALVDAQGNYLLDSSGNYLIVLGT